MRAMPNAAAAVRNSFTPWVASEGCTPGDKAVVTEVFRACGVADEVRARRSWITSRRSPGRVQPITLCWLTRSGSTRFPAAFPQGSLAALPPRFLSVRQN